MLRQVERKPRQGAGRKPKKLGFHRNPIKTPYSKTLEEAGLTRKIASNWQTMAELPQEKFTEVLEEVEKTNGEITTRAVVIEIKKKKFEERKTKRSR